MYNILASQEQLDKVVVALKANGIDSYIAKDGADANAKVLGLIPKGAQVMTMSSVTLDTLGITKELNESGNFDSIRTKLTNMDSKTQGREMRQMAAAPDYVTGSVHAVTEDGKVIIASMTGSQLPAYVYGADKVIWVVGTQKITKDIEDARKRLQEYVLPLESERANKAYNMTAGSFIAKELIINKEITPGRITIVFVPEVLGF